MKYPILTPLVLIAAIASQGCVSNKKYAELQSKYDELQQRSRDLNQKYQRILQGFNI